MQMGFLSMSFTQNPQCFGPGLTCSLRLTSAPSGIKTETRSFFQERSKPRANYYDYDYDYDHYHYHYHDYYTTTTATTTTTTTTQQRQFRLSRLRAPLPTRPQTGPARPPGGAPPSGTKARDLATSAGGSSWGWPFEAHGERERELNTPGGGGRHDFDWWGALTRFLAGHLRI